MKSRKSSTSNTTNEHPIIIMIHNPLCHVLKLCQIPSKKQKSDPLQIICDIPGFADKSIWPFTVFLITSTLPTLMIGPPFPNKTTWLDSQKTNDFAQNLDPDWDKHANLANEFSNHAVPGSVGQRWAVLPVSDLVDVVLETQDLCEGVQDVDGETFVSLGLTQNVFSHHHKRFFLFERTLHNWLKDQPVGFMWIYGQKWNIHNY